MCWIQVVIVFLMVVTFGEMKEEDSGMLNNNEDAARIWWMNFLKRDDSDDMKSGATLANYNGNRTEPIDIPKPGSSGLFTKDEGTLLIVGDGKNETALLINTGYSVEVRLTTKQTRSYVTGETIGNYLFVYTRTIFYWANSADGVAGTTIQGKEGTPLETSIFFYNTKYKSYRQALDKRDGLVEVRIRVNVNADKDNEKFEPFRKKMKEIQTPGKVDITMKEYNSWYLDFPSTPYFAYPGSLKNVSTKVTKNCVITIVTQVVLNISRNQFEETFLNIFNNSMKNADDKFSTEQIARDSNGRPIVHITEKAFVRFPSGVIDDGNGLHSEDGF